MKLLTAILMLMFTLSALATSETKTFIYDGSQDSIQMTLRAEKTHTEYRYEQHHTICYRQEVRYQTICRNTPHGRICQTVPRYVTVSYPCLQTIRIPYEVKDYDVDALVSINVEKALVPARETFKVTLDGDRLQMTAVGSKKFFILLKNSQVQDNMSGTVKYIDADYSVQLVEAALVLKTLNLSNMSLKNSALTFNAGPVLAPEYIGFALDVKKAPLVGSDTTLFDRELHSSEIEIKSEASGSKASVSLENLGVELVSGRYTLTAKAFFKHSGSLLNASQFEATEAARTLIYKIR